MRENKGITLVALVVTIIVLIILAGVSINMIVGENGIISMAQKAKENMEMARKEEETQIEELANQLEQGLGEELKTENKPNAPELTTGMTPIKFTEPSDNEKGVVVETNKEDKQWYNYEEKKWANAQTEDGSMWVWIPRFAYKVNSNTQNFDVVFLIGTTDTYYDQNGNIQTAKRCTSENEVVDTSTGFTVHPAFTDETTINYRNGGWDKELTGIWVAKFEAGYASGNNDAEVVASSVNYTQDTCWVSPVEEENDTSIYEARNWLDGVYGEATTSIKYPVFQPLTYSMNYINHNDAYNIAKKLTEEGNIYGLTQSADSHLMKNSEWGAVVYLSKSKYGLNTEDIAINNITLNSGGAKRTNPEGKSGVDSVYAVTGCTTGKTDEVEKQTTIDNINTITGNTEKDGVYTWNQKNGTKASTTGSIYGIYDMSGGTWERTAGYVANNNEHLKEYGKDIAYDKDSLSLRTVSTKYTTVYPYEDSTDNVKIENTDENLEIASKNNWIVNTLIYGDAIRETSTAGIENMSWYSDDSHFPGLFHPFICRGGNFAYEIYSGLFAFARNDSYSGFNSGFRAVIILS